MKINKILIIFSLILSCVFVGKAQTPTPTATPAVVGEVTVTTKYANSDPLYQKIRQNLNNKNLSGDVATVNNLVLQKDRGAFTLRSGEIYFLAPVEGRVTGAVFIGDGEFSLTPPVEVEKKSMTIFTGTPDIKEEFSELVMYFSDKTYEDVKSSPNVKMGTNGSKASSASSALQEKGNILKRQFRYNMSSRILADFLTPQRPGFFTSFIDGKKLGSMVYIIDPLGITQGGRLPGVYPEQIALIGCGDTNWGIWTAFHIADEYKKGTANSWTDRRIYDITNHDIDTTIQGQRVIAKDVITIQMREPNIKFLPFDFYSTLRVKTVTNENGEELSFIQEKKDEDADFGVILPNSPEVGKSFKIKVEYEGTDVVNQEGTGNYILNPAARSNWYPNNPFVAFGDRATFNLTFRYPKQYVMVGVGNRVGEETEENGLKVSKWSSGVEFEVAGFNYGDFKSKTVSDPSGYELEVFANHDVPDDVKAYQQQLDEAERTKEQTGYINTSTVGAMNTIAGMDRVLADTQNSTRIYNAYFGKLPYKRIAITQQPDASFGQAWTTLVFMPYTAYFDENIRTQLFGMRGGSSIFYTEVAPHEISHQWWGHVVGWTSYRDQWMSEGFATFSASLFIQFVKKDMTAYTNYWEIQRKRIVEPATMTKGLKPYTVGPLTQGTRLISYKTGNAYVPTVYPKGAYVLQMLRMMLYDHNKGGDARFKTMMQDFIKTNYNKSVSTEDFKKAVERNMTPEMDIDKNKTMNWFFDEWVYGTEMPSYKLEYQVTGDKLTGKLTQSGVSKNFVMIVPLYIDFGSGWQYLGSVTMVGNDTIDLGSINVPKAPKKFAVAALNDVLAENIENIKK